MVYDMRGQYRFGNQRQGLIADKRGIGRFFFDTMNNGTRLVPNCDEMRYGEMGRTGTSPVGLDASSSAGLECIALQRKLVLVRANVSSDLPLLFFNGTIEFGAGQGGSE